MLLEPNSEAYLDLSDVDLSTRAWYLRSLVSLTGRGSLTLVSMDRKVRLHLNTTSSCILYGKCIDREEWLTAVQ